MLCSEDSPVAKGTRACVAGMRLENVAGCIPIPRARGILPAAQAADPARAASFLKFFIKFLNSWSRKPLKINSNYGVIPTNCSGYTDILFGQYRHLVRVKPTNRSLQGLYSVRRRNENAGSLPSGHHLRVQRTMYPATWRCTCIAAAYIFSARKEFCFCLGQLEPPHRYGR